MDAQQRQRLAPFNTAVEVNWPEWNRPRMGIKPNVAWVALVDFTPIEITDNNNLACCLDLRSSWRLLNHRLCKGNRFRASPAGKVFNAGICSEIEIYPGIFTRGECCEADVTSGWRQRFIYPKVENRAAAIIGKEYQRLLRQRTDLRNNAGNHYALR